MCGLAGLVDPTRTLDLESALLATDAGLAGRGPDGRGLLVDRGRGVGLRHHRLAIFDPRPEADQPMTSASGRFTVVFNGSIHDHPERREELRRAGAGFRTTCDTEVLLAGFERWGVESTLARVDGMFALGLLDRDTNTLLLARDRAGQKPLLLATASGRVAFASDLRAIEALPAPFDARVRGLDESALHWFLALGVVPWPMSIRPGVEQVAPGGLVRISLETGAVDRGRWWSPPIPESARDPDAPGGPATPGTRPLLDILRESVHRRCRADRPVGVFLSAGIDSRLVAALAAECRGDLPAFTLAGEGPFDESAEAAAIAERLGLPHHVIRPDAAEILETVRRMPSIADEPFADASLVATTLLARSARERIVVALGGDGGDELFGGYRRHAVARSGGRLARGIAAMIDRWPRSLTGRLRIGRDSLADAARRRRLADPGTLDHEGLRSTQGDAADLLEPVAGDPRAFARAAERSTSPPRAPWDGPRPPIRSVRDLMAADFRTYLPDDPLAKVDRATMSVGLEARSPLLGRDVIAAAFAMPTDALFDRRGGRAPLRAALTALGLPDTGSKRGFAVPIFDWLRGPLRDDAASLLLEPAEDPLSPTRLATLFDDVQAGRRDRATACWTAMCWRAWLRSR